MTPRERLASLQDHFDNKFTLVGDGFNVQGSIRDGFAISPVRGRSAGAIALPDDSCDKAFYAGDALDGDIVYSNIPVESGDDHICTMCTRHLFFCGGDIVFWEEGDPNNLGSTEDYIDLALSHFTLGSNPTHVAFIFYGLRHRVEITPSFHIWEYTIGPNMEYFDQYVLEIET